MPCAPRYRAANGEWADRASTRLDDGQVIYGFKWWGRLYWSAPGLETFYQNKSECRAALDRITATPTGV